MPPARHWLHPQTVPRGFLRLYILTLLSQGPQTGYSIIQLIDEKTEGAWKPGAGTMYPLLKGLLKEGLVTVKGARVGDVSKTYTLTTKGSKELDQTRRMIASAGKKEPVMMRLFSELLPGIVYVPMVVRRYTEGAEVLRRKMAEVPHDERKQLLKELRLVAESQIIWIDKELAEVRRRARGGPGPRL